MTWELPTAAVLGWVLAAALMLPAGQGLAGFWFGGGWVWPPGSHGLLASVGGLLTGQSGRGLPATSPVPPAVAVYLLITIGEVLLFVATIAAALAWWHRLGPGARSGMAGRGEAEQVLGESRLRQARAVIRPDLYGKPARRRA